ALAFHFLKKLSEKSDKKIHHISDTAIQTLQRYEWPGNIRELEHLIERQFILTTGDQMDAIAIPESQTTLLPGYGKLETMEEMERTHIMKVLEACNGRVSGMMGAAGILNIPAQTLYSKMKKLGIKSTYK
ncbi:helix-turn-helix domain-containing protein, partial [Chitinophaga sp.]|uniref:helix-turn-helix domain-containing protein n=1 Tax=Chitinophaga sp. TaxID=1869181 RepID=UPI002F92373D